MDVNRVIFRGDIGSPGTWYGRVEKQKDDTQALILFKRPEQRSKPQLLADKVNDVHKGGKLATDFIAGKLITIKSDVTHKDLLQKYMQSAVQNDTTLDKIAELIRAQSTQNIGPKGNVNFLASVRPAAGVPGVDSQPVTISWEPNGPTG